ncbi:acyl-CoA thioesterase [Haliea sp. E17]|uniref:acyl-CoA thioesterase n=1 Tax=Haliea sp. E17 TaxID=3401576 RepID=UPI003AAC50E1
MDSNIPDSEVAQALLALEKLDQNHFRNCYNQDNQVGMMFGGQLLAQGLAAAQETTPPWPVHNCSACFPSPGSSRKPVEYRVEIVRDGKRFANRRVTGVQDGKLILDMLCAFNAAGPGLEHQLSTAPEVPPPEGLVPEIEFVRKNAGKLPAIVVAAYTQAFPVDVRVVDMEKVFFDRSAGPQRDYWFRMPSAGGLSLQDQHDCMLAFLSDYRLGAAAIASHLSPLELERMIIATLNHSMWFHQPAKTDEWLLYTTDSPWSGGGRGLARGAIYNRDGELVATVIQELMVGIRDRA